VRELRERNSLGCSHLIDLYQLRLTGEAVNVFCIPPADAEEIVSDVLLAVVEQIGSFEFRRSDADFHLWVMTIFRNRVRDFVRHQALTEGLVEPFQESLPDDEGGYSPTEKEVIAAIVRQYEESLHEPDDVLSETQREHSRKLQVIAETLDQMEAWERVLLRCRALDVSYEDIAGYTGRPAKLLKTYYARTKKKFLKLLAQYYPEVVEA
jgi:RNA polymerase sigma factor (sigma-70 family)